MVRLIFVFVHAKIEFFAIASGLLLASVLLGIKLSPADIFSCAYSQHIDKKLFSIFQQKIRASDDCFAARAGESCGFSYTFVIYLNYANFPCDCPAYAPSIITPSIFIL